MITYQYWFINDAKDKMLMTGENRCGIGGELSMLFCDFFINLNLF